MVNQRVNGLMRRKINPQKLMVAAVVVLLSAIVILAFVGGRVATTAYEDTLASFEVELAKAYPDLWQSAEPEITAILSTRGVPLDFLLVPDQRAVVVVVRLNAGDAKDFEFRQRIEIVRRGKMACSGLIEWFPPYLLFEDPERQLLYAPSDQQLFSAQDVLRDYFGGTHKDAFIELSADGLSLRIIGLKVFDQPDEQPFPPPARKRAQPDQSV